MTTGMTTTDDDTVFRIRDSNRSVLTVERRPNDYLIAIDTILGRGTAYFYATSSQYYQFIASEYERLSRESEPRE